MSRDSRAASDPAETGTGDRGGGQSGGGGYNHGDAPDPGLAGGQTDPSYSGGGRLDGDKVGGGGGDANAVRRDEDDGR